MRHVWHLTATGDVDPLAYDQDQDCEGLPSHHNGPQCARCGFSFCEHCVPDLAAALAADDCEGA